METEYKYKTPDVCKAVGRSRWTLIKWEKEGRFTPPRSVGGHRIFTAQQLQDIMEAFSPSGEHQWHFTK